MALSEASKSSPVIRHFYPIHPQTALQQQSAVYSTSDNPLVAPILTVSPAQPLLSHAGNHRKKKRKLEEVDSEIEYLGSYPPGSLSRTIPHLRQPRNKPSHQISEAPAIRLGPRNQRHVPYVELPAHSSIDLTMYRPVSLASLGVRLHIRQNGSDNHTHPHGISSPASPDAPAVSGYQYSGDFIHGEKTQQMSRVKGSGRDAKDEHRGEPEDDAATCHQCRRKTTKAKMRCRNVRPNGRVCPFLYCEHCIAIRYDDLFNSSHLSWHCPHCRGICNCSICLRKAGFGYILDGSISEQLTGVQGRLSVAGRMKKPAPSGKFTNKQSEGETAVSVRAWLARKGIAVGTQEWMEERRRQGVRIVVGKSPPPTESPSPYKEAQFNPTLAACTDYFEEEEDVDASLSTTLLQDDGGITISPGPLPDATGLPPIHNRQPLLLDGRHDQGVINGATAAHCHKEPPSQPFSLCPSDADASVLSTSSEDLPGLSSALTRGLRLIAGKPLPGAMGKKKQASTLNVKRKQLIKVKKKRNVDDSDFEELDQTTQRMTVIPVRDGDSGMSVRAMQEDSDSGEEMESARSLSPTFDNPYSLCRVDGPSTPVLLHEPVLVPTERYVPSKLDATMAKDSQTQVGHTLWSFNTVASRESEHKQEHGHGSSSSLLMSTPLYSNNDRHLSPQFSLEDGIPGPHQSPFESTSSSKLHTLDDYLDRHSHAQDDDAYLANSLAAFTTLDETWATIDMAPYSNMENDVSPLQT